MSGATVYAKIAVVASSVFLSLPGTLPAAATPPLVMEKCVSPGANFVLYRPKGWNVKESIAGASRTLTVSDPRGYYRVVLTCGISPTGGDMVALGRRLAGKMAKGVKAFSISGAFISPDRNHLVFDATFSEGRLGKRMLRCWVSRKQEEFSAMSIEVPAGRYQQARQLLLVILSNIRVTRGAFQERPRKKIPLVRKQLRDGSASFLIPATWRLQDFGTGCFASADPLGNGTFVVANVEVVTPQLRVRVPGTLVSPYLPPHSALEFIATQQGLINSMRTTEVLPRHDIARLVRTVYTTGPVTAEEFTYRYVSKGRRGKGYTFGISFGSRLGLNWRFWHITVGAPEEGFDSLAHTLAAMVRSYTINNRFARDYIARGTRRIQELATQTRRLVARNAGEIRRIMQAAYDERQRSQEYIDYQRTNYIRGEQDWISRVEGGTVYHTDSWGTKNTVTGEFWEGKHYNYVHFKGENPKYREQMTPVNSRELYESHVR